MRRSRIAGMGFYVPDNVVTNDDLAKNSTPATNGYESGPA